ACPAEVVRGALRARDPVAAGAVEPAVDLPLAVGDRPELLTGPLDREIGEAGGRERCGRDDPEGPDDRREGEESGHGPAAIRPVPSGGSSALRDLADRQLGRLVLAD